jgi:hypothetical protein
MYVRANDKSVPLPHFQTLPYVSHQIRQEIRVLRHSLNTLSIHFALTPSIVRDLSSEARSALRVLLLLTGWGNLQRINFDENGYWQRRVEVLKQMTALETIVLRAKHDNEVEMKRWSKDHKKAVKLLAGLEVDVRVEVKTA